jgi:TPR repeat protein
MATRLVCAALLLVAAGACKRAPAPAPGACETAAACLAVAEAELRSPSPSSDTVVAVALGKACNLRSGEACLRLSHFLALHGAERIAVNALLDQACDAGHHGACVTVAEALLDGTRGRTRDVPRGLSLLERACKGGQSDGCARLSQERQKSDAGAGPRATTP